MMKMKLNKKIAGATAMLMISAAMLGTSTFAWFTMNKTVTVTGMEMKTTVGSNLLVSPDTTEANFKTSLSQSRQALLEPVSTVNGLNYFYTVNAKGNGDAQADDYVAYSESTALTATDTFANKTKYDATFNGDTKYNITTANPATAAAYQTGYGYVDYNFYLKASATDANQQVVMTDFNLLYNNATITDTPMADKAWRAAVFVQKLGDANQTSCGTGIAPGESGGASLVSIIKRDGAVNQTANYAISAAATAPTEIPSANRDQAVVIDDTIAANTTEYYYVVIRVWLEGEDTTCTSQTYATLTNAWQVGTEFKLQTGATGAVTQITSDVAKTKASSGS